MQSHLSLHDINTGDRGMNLIFKRTLSALVLGSLALIVSVGGLEAKPTADNWSVEDVMKKVLSMKGAFPKSQAAVKDGKWDDAAKVVKDIKKGGEDLAKNDAPKGDKESWKKLTKTFGENTKALSDAVEKKDKEAFDKAAKAIGGSCKTCHDAHK
jgi:cytochrome c556